MAFVFGLKAKSELKPKEACHAQGEASHRDPRGSGLSEYDPCRLCDGVDGCNGRKGDRMITRSAGEQKNRLETLGRVGVTV